MFNVICVDNAYNPFLTPNEMYFVEEENETHYKMHNDAEKLFWYDKNLFKKVQDKQKVKILCADKADYSYITKGKIYEAEDYDTNYYQLVNDEGDVSLYRKTCFVISNEATPVSTPVKPPLGLTPRKLYWEELNYHRRQDIIAAMQRRVDAKMDIPIEWCQELIDLVIADKSS